VTEIEEWTSENTSLKNGDRSPWESNGGVFITLLENVYEGGKEGPLMRKGKKESS